MTKPNFLIIQADQLTACVLASYGHPIAKTPHMDALAATGTVFQNAYCSYPLCGPSRMSMMTGRLASRIGAFDNAAEFRSEIPTFAHYLRAEGYRTALSGKMHFVGADQLHGFETRLTTDIYPSDFYWTENLETRDDAHKSDNRGVTECGVCDRSVQLDYDEMAVFQAEQYLWDVARDPGEPFCLFVSLTHPHDPYYCTQDYFDRYSDEEVPLPNVGRVPTQAADPLSQFIAERHELNVDFDPAVIRKARRAYLGSVSYFDDQIGRLRQVLQRARLDQNTIVIVLGDHGEMLGERGLWFKRHFYEWSARVPMIFSGGPVAAGRVETCATLTDLTPTLMALAGGRGTAALVEPIEGRDLSPLVTGSVDNAVDDVAHAEVMSDGLAAPIFMIRRQGWKLIWGPEHPAQLYDLAADPGEVADLANAPEHEARRDTMIAEAEAVWDCDALQADIDRSIARRLLIRQAHDVGTPPRWDYVAPSADARWCRSGTNYNEWSLTVLNPR